MKILFKILFPFLLVTIGWSIAMHSKPETRTEVVKVEVPKYITETKTVVEVQTVKASLPTSCTKANSYTADMHTQISVVTAGVGKQQLLASAITRDSVMRDFQSMNDNIKKMQDTKDAIDTASNALTTLKQDVTYWSAQCAKESAK